MGFSPGAARIHHLWNRSNLSSSGALIGGKFLAGIKFLCWD